MNRQQRLQAAKTALQATNAWGTNMIEIKEFDGELAVYPTKGDSFRHPELAFVENMGLQAVYRYDKKRNQVFMFIF